MDTHGKKWELKQEREENASGRVSGDFPKYGFDRRNNRADKITYRIPIVLQADYGFVRKEKE
ncbi:hypothetical protein LPW11_02320 [Geomonas sp. RF6]|uniref:hypothetical protein n=1 Tax=Geomonas sp. RF6 TaxID=2897342 RepID=UPI001E525614|nr:hypothetical protein [Geomonas sp. RF6]UFS71033.1 hypothetical protein LPW11_02320 [Geomonas sp. RF6]